jgi:hypothetical protein
MHSTLSWHFPETQFDILPSNTGVKEEKIMSKTGSKVLLTPKDGFLLLIDYLPFQFTKQHSHIQIIKLNNIIALAKTKTGLQDV